MAAAATDSTPTSTARATAPDDRTRTIGEGRPGPELSDTPSSTTSPRPASSRTRSATVDRLSPVAAPSCDLDADPVRCRHSRSAPRLWRRTTDARAPARGDRGAGATGPVARSADESMSTILPSIAPSGPGTSGKSGRPARRHGDQGARQRRLTRCDVRHTLRVSNLSGSATNSGPTFQPSLGRTSHEARNPSPRAGRRFRRGSRPRRIGDDSQPGRTGARGLRGRALQGPGGRQDPGLPALPHRRHHQRRDQARPGERLHRRRVGPTTRPASPRSA